MKIAQRLISLICPAILLVLSFTRAEAQTTNGKIAFVRGGDIYTVLVGQTTPVNLTNNAAAQNRSPAFSPDGGKIAFVSLRDGSDEIFIMNQDGTNQTRLTTNQTYDVDPSFSPDGSKIIFVSNRTGNYDVYTMNLDGTNLIRITATSESEGQPKYSPDGAKIVYIATPASGALSVSVYQMNAEGSGPVRLTFGINDATPSYSPDGAKIVFRRFDNASFSSSVITMNSDGSGLTPVVQNDSNTPISKAGFSPDGTKIIWDEQFQINPSVFRVRILNATGINDAKDFAWQPVRPAAPRARFDFDGDGKADFAVFRPSNGVWYIQRSRDGFLGTAFGADSDLLAPADYDGDGKTDIGVFRPSNGVWYYIRSSDNQLRGVQWGQSGDKPLPADFDGDGKDDINVFRPSNGVWYRINSSNGQFAGNLWGQNGDTPLVADFDGDGKADLTVFRPSEAVFYWLESQTGTVRAAQTAAVGQQTIIPALADYNGDKKTDVAVYNVTTRYYTTPFSQYLFGNPSETKFPVPADYDGDGKADAALFVHPDGQFAPRGYYFYFTNTSTPNNFFWGYNTDKPAQAAFNQ